MIVAPLEGQARRMKAPAALHGFAVLILPEVDSRLDDKQHGDFFARPFAEPFAEGKGKPPAGREPVGCRLDDGLGIEGDSGKQLRPRRRRDVPRPGWLKIGRLVSLRPGALRKFPIAAIEYQLVGV